MAKATTTDLWDRRENESPKAYEAFSIYRDLGPERSLAKVSERLSKSEQLMKRWSSKYEWVKRAAAWDDEQDRIEREIAQKEQAKAIREMRKRHADLAKAMLIKSAKALSRIPDDEIKPGDVSRMVDVASKLERISRGDVGEVVEERNGGKAEPVVTFYMPSNNREDGDGGEEN